MLTSSMYFLQVKLEKHASQKDYSTGFGGKYGIQEELKDKVCMCNILTKAEMLCTVLFARTD